MYLYALTEFRRTLVNNFQLYNPIRMVFGVGEFSNLADFATQYGEKPLVVFGKESAKVMGVMDKALEMLTEAGLDPVPFEGIEPNPRVATIKKAAELAKESGCDMVIGIGGGSVMDASKVIAFGALDPDNIWTHIAHWEDYYEPVGDALPILLVSTLAATGSEGDAGAVVTNEETGDKVGVFGESMFPKVSIIDPELTLTTPKNYTRDGAVDMIMHVLESYFNGEPDGFADRMTESFIIEVMIALEDVLENLEDIDARSRLSWLGAIALHGFINRPRGGMFPLHVMQHPLSAYYDISHGSGLAMLLPRWMKFVYHEKPDRIIQLGERVFNLDLETHHPFEAAEIVIERVTNWLEDIGAWFFMDDLGIPNDPEMFAKMADDILRVFGKGEDTIGGLKPLSKEDMIEIYSMCVRTGAAEEHTVEPEPETAESVQEGEDGEVIEIVEEVIVVEEGEPLPEGVEGEEIVVVEEIVEEDTSS